MVSMERRFPVISVFSINRVCKRFLTSCCELRRRLSCSLICCCIRFRWLCSASTEVGCLAFCLFVAALRVVFFFTVDFLVTAVFRALVPVRRFCACGASVKVSNSNMAKILFIQCN